MGVSIRQSGFQQTCWWSTSSASANRLRCSELGRQRGPQVCLFTDMFLFKRGRALGHGVRRRECACGRWATPKSAEPCQPELWSVSFRCTAIALGDMRGRRRRASEAKK